MAYKDVAMTRKQMAEALTGKGSKIGVRRIKSSGNRYTHGDVWGPLNKAFRKKEAKDRKIEARRQKQFDDAEWIL
jgi:hypothetical protein